MPRPRTPTRCGIVLLVAACSAPLGTVQRRGAASAAAPAPSALRATAMCVSGAAGADRTSLAMRQGAQRVCDALETRKLEVARPPATARAEGSSFVLPWRALTTGWSPGAAGVPRLLFFEGHGQVRATRATSGATDDGCDGEGRSARELCLFGPLGGQPFVWSELAKPILSPGGWGVVLLAACDSGFADVRGIDGTLSVLGSGYAHVPLGVAIPGSKGEQTQFADLLAKALATDDTDVNCDGVITDREVQLRLNTTLRQVLSRNDSNPIAVIRRQSDADVPLLWRSHPLDRCGAKPQFEALLASDWARTLPQGLRRDLEEQSRFLRRERNELVESPVRYLLVSDERSPPGERGLRDAGASARADVLSLLAAPGRRLGVRVLSLGSAWGASSEERLANAAQLARFATFTRMFSLVLTDDTATLKSLDDGEELMTLVDDFSRHESPNGPRGRHSAADQAYRILRCVPRRIELVGLASGDEHAACDDRRDPEVHGNCAELGDFAPCIALRIDGRFPSSAVRLVRWTDLVAGKEPSAPADAAVPDTVNWNNARAAPCHAGVGQCFVVENPRAVPRAPGAWAPVEDDFPGRNETLE